jgi:hypothetical protein
VYLVVASPIAVAAVTEAKEERDWYRHAALGVAQFFRLRKLVARKGAAVATHVLNAARLQFRNEIARGLDPDGAVRRVMLTTAEMVAPAGGSAVGLLNLVRAALEIEAAAVRKRSVPGTATAPTVTPNECPAPPPPEPARAVEETGPPAETGTGYPDEKERERRRRRGLVEGCRNEYRDATRGGRLTNEMIAKHAKATWHTSSPVEWYISANDRLKAPDVRSIERALRERHWLPK